MPKKNIKKQKFSKKHVVYALVGFVILILGVWIYNYAQNQREIDAEKADLLSKQQQIESISDKIAELYPPNERNSSQTCQYQNRKFEKGNLYCQVSILMKYNSFSYRDANSLKNEASKLVSTNVPYEYLHPQDGYKEFSASNSILEGKKVIRDVNLFIQDLERLTDDNLECHTAYSYPYDEYESSSKDFSIKFSCQRLSKAEHFTVVR